MTELTEAKFPIGRFKNPTCALEPSIRAAYINEIEELPGVVRDLVSGLDDEHLAATYRPGGWSVRQLVHHLADSHVNGYVRMKWAMTEDTPTIKLYDQAAWGSLADASTAPVLASLQLLDGLHQRWCVFLRALRPADFDRTLVHPKLGSQAIDVALALYRWHGRHHSAHIRVALGGPRGTSAVPAE